MKIKRIIFSLALILFIGGCAGSKENRLGQIRAQYPQWDQDTVENVASRKITVGMTEEMVSTAMGKPWSIEREGEMTTWAYGYFRSCGPEGYACQKLSWFISFRDNKVTGTYGDRSKLGFSYQ